ncbi:hypothetical protein LAZ67_13000764 [Cordylochernes scorpioides]|uniref:Retrovirus-related Pol polyprotein from type-1 retrotransposable element R1 n=1 Tax=Cordylochernes scorpioides TaxID=51811 RepID=A0ABY6L384_9ARAC|nr:hypothetical protein LAZ67_13000764 [Cordylochernes scorpioides]
MDNLLHHAALGDADLILIQEPPPNDDRYKMTWQMISSHDNKSLIFINPMVRSFCVHTSTHTSTIQILKEGRSTFITNCYVPPVDPTQEDSAFSTLLDDLEAACNKVGLDNHIIMGDFNAHNSLFGGNHNDLRGEKLLDFVYTKQLEIISDISRPTFDNTRHLSHIDHTFSSFNISQSLSWTAEPFLSTSDHVSILLKLPTPDSQETPPLDRPRFNVNYAKRQRFVNLLNRRINNLPVFNPQNCNTGNLDEYIDLLTNIIGSSCKKINKQTLNPPRYKERHNPWWNENLQTLKNKAMALKRLYKATDNDATLRLNRVQRFRVALAIYKKAIRRAKNSFYKKHFETITTSNPFTGPYKIISGKKLRPTTFHSFRKTNGELTKTADETFAYFISQKYLDTTSDTDTTPFELQDSGQQHYYPLISMVEISSAIRTMGHKKAPGPDGIMRNPILFLNDEHPVILNNLYNACLFLGYFPQAWKIGHIIFLQKKDKDPRDITSLRPITLLNLFGKILDKIIVNRITYHLQVTNRLNDSQFGFRWGKSCEEALRKVKDILHKSRLVNNHSIVISMDIEGAFDNASWDIIRESLKEKEVPPYLRTMIHSYLCSRKVSSDASPQSLIDPLQITRGCPQGSNSGPLFWILYMDPIFSILKDENVHTIAYADDLLLICTSTSRVKVENITNRALETLHTWITSRKLNIAPKKSAALYVAPAGRNKGAGKGGVRNPAIRMDGNHILFKNTLKFLGVTFNRHLTWVDHAKSIRDKVLSKGMELRRLTRENRGLAPLVTKRLYKAGFERIICYAASVWWRQENNSLTHKILSSAQRPFALAICRGYNTLSTDAALVLSGLVPINNILTLESKRAELIRPGSDMDTDPTPEQVDSPPLQWYCHPAEVHLITYDKSIPDSSSLTIYTDGSKSDDGVGAGWCLYSRNISLLKKSYILREENSVFQAECLAIYKALEWFLEQPHQSITLASDSLSSLESLASPYTKSWSVMRNKILVNNIINSGKTVSFHWVKAHVGLEGNEMADSLARLAFKYPAPYVPIPTPKSWFKYSARKKAISDWQTSWDASLKGRSLYNWIKFVKADRIYSSSALNSILTGHGPFSNYFQRFKIKTPSPCRCGYANPDSDHFLLACPLLDSSRPRCLKKPNPNKPHLLSDHRKALTTFSEIAVAFSKDLYPPTHH